MPELLGGLRHYAKDNPSLQRDVFVYDSGRCTRPVDGGRGTENGRETFRKLAQSLAGDKIASGARNETGPFASLVSQSELADFVLIDRFRNPSLAPNGPSLDSFHGSHQVFVRVRVAEADVAFAEFAEARSVQTRHARIGQQRVGDFLRSAPEGFDIRKGVERAAGNGAAPAGDIV